MGNAVRPAPKEETEPVPAPSGLRAWLLTLLLVGAAFALHGWHRARVRAATPPAAFAEGKTTWVLIARLPSITAQYESGVDTMTRRYDEWLKALTEAGYHPVTFSDVRHAQATGKGLPVKPLLLTFDPALRRTLDLVSPTFQKRRWRAAWLSDDAAMRDRHREYVTYHRARQMANAGLWDVGLREADGTYLFPYSRAGRFTLGAPSATWRPTSGARSVNALDDRANLTRLNVLSDWTPEDLVNRLDAEIPVEGPSALTVGAVQHLSWGLARPRPARAATRFDLDALPDRTGHVISWFGTEGLDDARVTATGQALAGFLSLRFRWDDDAGNGVQVVVSGDEVLVQERVRDEPHQLLRVPRTGDKSGPRFALTAEVARDRLTLSVDGAAPRTVKLTTPAGSRGFFQIHLFDRIRDVAHVSALDLTFDPLPSPQTPS